jgi:hypothetical protein
VDIPRERERLLHRRRLHNMALTYWHPRGRSADTTPNSGAGPEARAAPRPQRRRHSR